MMDTCKPGWWDRPDGSTMHATIRIAGRCDCCSVATLHDSVWPCNMHELRIRRWDGACWSMQSSAVL